MTKPPRLPQPCTLDEAAQWLSAECAQTWTARSVLSRFIEWEGSNEGAWRAFAPPTLMVMIDAGIDLLDCADEFKHISFSYPLAMEVTAPVDNFITDMLAVGKAKPQGLRHPVNERRYKITEAIAMDTIRIPAEWVHLLKPTAQTEGAKVGAGKTARPEKQSVFQENELIKALTELKFDPLKLDHPGKAGAQHCP